MLLPHADSNFTFFQIGCGGIGSYVSLPLTQYLSSHNDFNGKSRLVLIDGDVLEAKNLTRQNFEQAYVAIPKAVASAEMIANRMGLAPRVIIEPVPEYLTEKNIGNILTDNSTILLCPDNAKCRVLVEDWALANCKNVAIICAGNDFDDGQVQLMIIKDGELLTPPLTKHYPELRELALSEKPVTERVPEQGCQVMAESNPQLIFANIMAATLVLSYIYALAQGTVDSFVSIFDVKRTEATPFDFNDKEFAEKLKAYASKASETKQPAV